MNECETLQLVQLMHPTGSEKFLVNCTSQIALCR